MARPTSKKELVESACGSFEQLWKLIDSMSGAALNTEFDFSQDKSKKKAHWTRDKNLRDVLVHLYEWHQLLVSWINSNLSEVSKPLIPEPYSWKTYGEMNMEFWERHQRTQLDKAKKMLMKSHNESLALIQSFSDEELFCKKHFNWTGTTSLGSYCISAMSSHYDWAIKKLRAHMKRVSKE